MLEKTGMQEQRSMKFMKTERKTLMQLFIPISLETLCYMLAGMIDTLMLSLVGDQAVGAIGTANTYIGMFIIMFSIISSLSLIHI